MSYYKFPPIPVSQWATYVRDVKTYNTTRTLLTTDITTFWDTSLSELTVTLFPADQAPYDNTFHRYRIVNGGSNNLHVISPTYFWNDGIYTLTLLPRQAITISAVRVGTHQVWTLLEDVDLTYDIGTGTAVTIAGVPLNLTIGAVTSDLSEGTLTKDSTNVIIGATGDYRLSGIGTVVDTGSASLKIGYLTLRINRGGTILSRSSFSILTRGGGNIYTWFIPQQVVSLLAGDKVYFEFDPNTIAAGTVQMTELSLLRTVIGA